MFVLSKSKITLNLVVGVLVLASLTSLHPWFLWGVENMMILFCLFCLGGVFLIKPSIFDWKHVSYLSIFLLFVCFVYQSGFGNIFGLFVAIIQACLATFILAIHDDYKGEMLNKITKCIVWILLPSLFGHILYVINIPLPSSYIEYVNDAGEVRYMYYNFRLFMIGTGLVDSFFPRFSSVFLEPGQLGMFTSLLLAANKFRLANKYNLLLFIITLCTFSFAAYIIMFLGYLFQLFTEKHKYRFVVLISFLVTVNISWFVAITYENGDNIVNEMIFSRLELSGDDKLIEGNNRFSEDFSMYFSHFMQSSNKWLGIGSDAYGQMYWRGGNAGYKVYIVQYGLLGVFLILSLYFSFLRNRFSQWGCGLVVLFLISYLQRGYPLWICFLTVVILGICRMNDKSGT